jgi:hypothetical protein
MLIHGGTLDFVIAALWACALGFVCVLAGWSVVASWTHPRRLDRHAAKMRLSRAMPGWYLDPLGDAWWRCWDGDRWTGEICNDRYPPTYGTTQHAAAVSDFDEVPRNPLGMSRKLRGRIDLALIVAAIGFPLALLAIPGNQVRGLCAAWALLAATYVTAVFAFNSRESNRTKTRI